MIIELFCLLKFIPMGLFDSSRLEAIIERQLDLIIDQHSELVRCCRAKNKPNPVLLFLTISNQKSKFLIMALEFAANQLVSGVLSLIDSVTSAAVPATFDTVTAVSDNPAVAAASVNADGSVSITGVAAGSANVTISANASFTNSLGAATSGSVSSVVAVTVDAVATADGVSLVVTFGAPTQQ